MRENFKTKTNRFLQRDYKLKQILPHINPAKDEKFYSDKNLNEISLYMSHNFVTMPKDSNRNTQPDLPRSPHNCL